MSDPATRYLVRRMLEEYLRASTYERQLSIYARQTLNDQVTLAAMRSSRLTFIECAAGRFTRESDARLRRLFERTP